MAGQNSGAMSFQERMGFLRVGIRFERRFAPAVCLASGGNIGTAHLLPGFTADIRIVPSLSPVLMEGG